MLSVECLKTQSTKKRDANQYAPRVTPTERRNVLLQYSMMCNIGQVIIFNFPLDGL